VFKLRVAPVARSASMNDPPYPLPANVIVTSTLFVFDTRRKSGPLPVVTGIVVWAPVFKLMIATLGVWTSATTSESPPGVRSSPCGDAPNWYGVPNVIDAVDNTCTDSRSGTERYTSLRLASNTASRTPPGEVAETIGRRVRDATVSTPAATWVRLPTESRANTAYGDEPAQPDATPIRALRSYVCADVATESETFAGRPNV